MMLLLWQPTLTLCWLLELPVIRCVAFFAFLAFLLLHILQELAASKSIPVRTRVASLSQILREQGLSGKRIDLLKIDVERREDWKGPKQLSERDPIHKWKQSFPRSMATEARIIWRFLATDVGEAC